jgi:hypothetical protein
MAGDLLTNQCAEIYLHKLQDQPSFEEYMITSMQWQKTAKTL